MARRHIARYAVTTGLSGLYMPDCQHGAYEFTTRSQMADAIRELIEFMEFPKASFTQANIIRRWQFIKRYGSSVSHFAICHRQFEIAFHGLTEEEFNQMDQED